MVLPRRDLYIIVFGRAIHGILDVKAQPVQNSDQKYKLGIWIRDNAQGVGTMTYIDADGNFGALGHGIPQYT